MASPSEGSATAALRAVLEPAFVHELQRRAEEDPANAANRDRGIGIVSFITALAVALIIFAVQSGIFLMLRNKLARIL
jgi:hypothetical protein